MATASIRSLRSVRSAHSSHSSPPSVLSKRSTGSVLNPFGDFPDENFRKAGSMWAWAGLPERKYFVDSGPEPGHVNIMRTMTSWKWEDENLEDVAEVKVIKQEDIVPWLEEKVPEREGKTPCAGMRIVQINQPFRDEMPMTCGNFEAILSTFKLPPVELHQASVRQGAIVMLEEADGSYVLVHRRTHIKDLTSAIIRYDPVTNFTQGYLLTNFHHDRDLSYLEQIPYQFLGCCHFFLLPTILMEADFEHAMLLIKEFFDDLKDIEQQTGFTNYTSDTTIASKDNANTNYQVLIRTLGELHTLYLNNQTSLFAFQKCLKYLQGKLILLDRNLPDERMKMLKRQSVDLRARMEFLSSTLEHAVIYGNFQTRLQAQQAVLFNLINQADTQINIGLAKDSKELAAASKQDSSAMKIIAVLTTLFLPGTFVATLFSMPLLNWDSSSINKVTTTHFWVYWAVTGPLTIVTMAVVITWSIWHSRRTRTLIQQARDTLLSANSSDTSSVRSHSIEEKKRGDSFDVVSVREGDAESFRGSAREGSVRAPSLKKRFTMPNFMRDPRKEEMRKDLGRRDTFNSMA